VPCLSLGNPLLGLLLAIQTATYITIPTVE
jgi:hypothetical protein